MKIFVLIISFLTLFGCSTQAILHVNSQPVGAYITEFGTSLTFGIAPTSAYYDASLLEQHKDSNGCYIVKGITAKWVSGATATLSPIRLCDGITSAYNITINRDSSYPNLEKDLNFALQVQNILAQQQQAKAAQNAAFAQMWSTFSSTPTVNSTTNCTSYVIGNTLKTSCK